MCVSVTVSTYIGHMRQRAGSRLSTDEGAMAPCSAAKPNVYMYICVKYVCIYVCIYVYIYLSIYLSICLSIYLSIYICMYI